jgi:O-antigen ligase
MNVWSIRSDRIHSGSGVLFRRTAPMRSRAVDQLPEALQTESRGKHRLAFGGLYLILMLMYFRPQEVMPGVFGNLPLVKVAIIPTLLIYIVSKVNTGERVITWPLEMKMLAVMWMLGLLFLPIAASPQDSFNLLFDTFIKTVIVFILLVNLIDTRARLRSLLQILALCELFYALGAIKTFLSGGYADSFHRRITGLVSMFANPNDLASVLNLMLPFTVLFAVRQRGWARMFYFACAGIAAIAVLLTFSRSGFIGLVASCGLLVWKFARGHRVRIMLAAVIVSGVLLMALPDLYLARLSTIFDPETDTTNSAQERQLLMERAAELAVKRSVVGIGIGNFHIYSIRERAAHNSYLETAAELGIAGLIAYLVLIFAPISSLMRIERETRSDGVRPEREVYLMSICLQASFVAYIVYGFFGSVQYLNFLYFTVAYAISLRRIHSAETDEAARVIDGAEAPESHARARMTGGVLWSPHRHRERRLSGDRGSR